MVMNYLEASKGAQGLTSDQKKGVDLMNKFAKDLKKQGLLPQRFSFESQKDSLKSSETFVLQPFTDKEKKALTKDGYLIYPFILETIQTQKEAGKPFWYVVDAESELKIVPSMVGEVAFNPSPERFFIPKSNNKTLEKQEEMIKKYGQDLRRKLNLPDYIQAVMGDAPDYTQLAFTHLKKTGEYLFGTKYGFNYARTKTPTSGSCVANVGYFGADYGLDVGDWHRVRGHVLLFVVPLVVSIKTR